MRCRCGDRCKSRCNEKTCPNFDIPKKGSNPNYYHPEKLLKRRLPLNRFHPNIVKVHRYDPKTDEKIGDSMPKEHVFSNWLGYPKGQTPPGSFLRGNGPWEVHALGPGQKHTDKFGFNNPRSGELIHIRKD